MQKFCVKTKNKLGIPTAVPKTNIILHGSGKRTMLTPFAGNLLDGREIIEHWDTLKNEGMGAPYVVNRKGLVFDVFDPKHWTHHTGLKDLKIDKQSIPVMLATELGLEKNNYCYYPNGYIHSTNCYTGPVREFVWKGYNYWAKLSEEQITSTLELLNELCDNFKLAKTFLVNTKFDAKALSKATVVCHSAINDLAYDFPPFEDWVLAKIKEADFTLVG